MRIDSVSLFALHASVEAPLGIFLFCSEVNVNIFIMGLKGGFATLALFKSQNIAYNCVETC